MGSYQRENALSYVALARHHMGLVGSLPIKDASKPEAALDMCLNAGALGLFLKK